MGFLFGNIDNLLYSLIALTAIDYFTGVILAIYNKKLSSNIGFKGICKKMMMFSLVALSNIIDNYVMNCGGSLKTMLIMFYLSNEGISIIENASEIGLTLPEKLKYYITNLKDKKR